MINAPDSQPASVEYPAEFHFRIICDFGTDLIESIKKIASGYTVTDDLCSASRSSSGKYSSYSISIVFESRDQMICFDTEVKSISGVRMLL